MECVTMLCKRLAQIEKERKEESEDHARGTKTPVYFSSTSIAYISNVLN